MKYLDKKWKIALYGCAGIGVNMLNIIVGSYLCSALIVGGFAKEDWGYWTYTDKTLVVGAIWGTLILVAKIIDGIIDIPLSSFTDNLRTKFGRRRPAIVIGFIPMVISYLLFLVPLSGTESIANTIWFAVLLCIFYSSYTLTMVTYYATFAEIVKTDKERVFLSNTKSICDVVYFSISFALVPALVSMQIDIRTIALICLPFSLSMMIPLFLAKEQPTNGENAVQKVKYTGIIKSFTFSFKNKKYIYWLCTHAVMNFGLQLFLSGINEYFSTSGINMTFVMASSFAPIPFTLIIYNKLVKKKGIRFGFQYVLLVFSLGMSLMYVCRFLDKSILLYVAILCGIIVSFAIGAFFSVAYTIPSQLAAEENAKGEVCASSMYFAVQGLFEGVASGLATGVVLVYLKENELISNMPVLIVSACMAAFVMAFFLPKTIANIGKVSKDNEN